MTLNPDVLAWGAPVAWLVAGLLAIPARSRAWTLAAAASGIALATSLAWAAWQGWFAWHPRLDAGADLPGALMSLLIALLGWVIMRYSRRYLVGERGQVRFVFAMCVTLASVATVAVTAHLGVLLFAWASSSLALHQLLTFYRDRAAAQVAAHKKFLASRLAETCMLAALWLLYRETGTLSMAGVATHLGGLAQLPASLHAAAVLVALAVVLKSAQLPLHGWLIQVMEAPTPVSALLHAGIVNLGGFVLIRLSSLVSAAPAAQTLLVVVGGGTALLAGLVMMTRVSIKVRLAWSTCAQMGFMLMECGLGLYELALLHLLAHSLYKAHAFLGAGDTVRDARSRDLAPERLTDLRGGRVVASRLAAVPLALVAMSGSAMAWQAALPGFVIHPAALVIAGLGLAPLLWGRGAVAISRVTAVLRLLALTQLYLLWHLAFSFAVPAAAVAHPALVAVSVLCIAALYSLQVWLPAFPNGALSRRLHPLAFAGFHLDERFTRLAFRLWPAGRVPGTPRAATAGPLPLPGDSA